jgi:bifunctional NMN adenylyltransferase/nudix hydrolase
MSQTEVVQEKDFDLLVLILRGRIFHRGHETIVEAALAKAHNVLMLVGSDNVSRCHDGNEFIAEEAVSMIRAVYPENGAGARVSVRTIGDVMHDEADLFWLMGVQRAVFDEKKAIARWRGTEDEQGKLRIGLIGFSKDRTSYYLKKFPQWRSVNVEGYRHQGRIVSATDIRNEFFYGKEFGTAALPAIRNRVSEPVARWLFDWAMDNHSTIEWLRNESGFCVNYKVEHEFLGRVDPETGARKPKPYTANHSTTDAIVIQSGHVLLIRRRKNPGLGKWALPGGFLDPNERTRDGVIRELREETKLQMAANVLRLAFRHKVVFSDPYRSKRGRIITHAYLYLLNDRTTLPLVDPNGGDDADRAEWVPLGEVDPLTMYEDHYHILMKTLHLLPVD